MPLLTQLADGDYLAGLEGYIAAREGAPVICSPLRNCLRLGAFALEAVFDIINPRHKLSLAPA